jgi:DNA-directed RNA polymerase beta subunit
MIDSFHKYPIFPDLLENQRRSIRFFWEKGILDELELFSTLIGYQKEKNTKKEGAVIEASLPAAAAAKTGGPPPPPYRTADRTVSLHLTSGRGERGSEARPVSEAARSYSAQVFDSDKKQNIKKSWVFNGIKVYSFSDLNSPLENLKSEKHKVKSEALHLTPAELPEAGANKGDQQLRSGQLRSPKVKKAIFNVSKEQSSPQIESFNKNDTEYLVLHGSKFLLKAPQYSQIESIRYQKTYSVGLFLPIEQKRSPTAKLTGGGDEREGEGYASAKLRARWGASGGTSQSFTRGGFALTGAPLFWFYFGDIPLMTERGSFIINGAPRVLVNQIIRCPSVYFKVKLDQKNRRTYTASFLSEYGSWLRLETDRLGNRLWARIDKSPRFPADVLLMGLGYSLGGEGKESGVPPTPLVSFGDQSSLERLVPNSRDERGETSFSPPLITSGAPRSSPERSSWSGAPDELRSPGPKLQRLTSRSVPSMFSSQIVDQSNKPVLFNSINKVGRPNSFRGEATGGASLTSGDDRRSSAALRRLLKGRRLVVTGLQGAKLPRASLRGGDRRSALSTKLTTKGHGERSSPGTKNTLTESGVALQTIWKKCNPGRWTSSLGCYSFFYNKFLNPKRYSIGRVGRLRLNKRLLRNPECTVPTLTPEDVLLAFHYLTQLRSSDSLGNTGEAPLELDDIDHLKNRRVRLPGETLQNQFRLALSRIPFSALRFQDFHHPRGGQQLPESEAVRSGTTVSTGGAKLTGQLTGGSERSSPQVTQENRKPLLGIGQFAGQDQRSGQQLLVSSFARAPFRVSSPFSKKLREIGERAKLSSEQSGTSGRGDRRSGRSRAELLAKLSPKGGADRTADRTAPLRPFLKGEPAKLFGTPIPAFQNTIRELFNTGQLSQYMDQTNPLAEITHKRRLSSLGPGGVGRDQAGFAVREIHPSHFGRICPIETPEGQNAGLVGSLASYARINNDGFLQSPALPVEQQRQKIVTNLRNFAQGSSARVGANPSAASRTSGLRRAPGRASLAPPLVRSKVSLFSSELEDEIYVCTADTLNPAGGAGYSRPEVREAEQTGERSSLTEQRRVGGGKLTILLPSNVESPQIFQSPSAPLFPNFFPVRYKQEFLNIKAADALALTSAPTKLFTGVCPIQLISIATSLIPFLEHDDANRALMGSNMQRQAVPFMVPEKPFVGTGLELQAARDSSTVVLAKKSGEIIFVDSNSIKIQEENKIESYELTKFAPSNQSTSLKQRPAVQLGEWVEKGFLLADGSGTCDGEVALGKNVLLAYMPWEGYNFEDAIVINERLVFEDIYTSIHVERFEVDVKNAKILSAWELHEWAASPPGTPADQRSPGRSQRALPPPGEYLTSDLDILTGKFLRNTTPIGGVMTSGRSVSRPPVAGVTEAPVRDGETPPLMSSFKTSWTSGRPTKLRHLDARGIVRPGTWVQEGDILVGKVQIGLKEGGTFGNSLATVSHEGASRGYLQLSEGGGPPVSSPPALFASKTTSGQQKNPTLPFPEYRLLLAIFELQNRPTDDLRSENSGASLSGASDRWGTPHPSRLSEAPVDQSSLGKDGELRPPGGTPQLPLLQLLAAEKKLLESEMANRTAPREQSSVPSFNRPLVERLLEKENLSTLSLEDMGTRPVVPSINRETIASFGELRAMLPSSQQMTSVKNTSYKVGIGVKGRVLECVIEGQLPKYHGGPFQPVGGAKLTDRKRLAGFTILPQPPKGPLVSEGPAAPLVSSAPLPLPQETSSPNSFSGPPVSSVSIFLAHKKRIQLGDKMSGRHGNKGIVSLILPPQDMPYLQDGKSVDVVLNPLGVPSRMNVGQVLETLFGLSAFYSKKVYRIMPFDERIVPNKEKAFQKPETSRSLVYGYLKKLRDTIRMGGCFRSNSQLDWLFDANNPGKTQVFDGRTGEVFYQPVLVGYSYMFKLIHLVDDKIHARSTGPYSLVTQQPLGGRSKKGGQRLGEMEVWALEGFGTASILQEFLTVKSDEIYSRNHFLFHLMRRNWDSLEKIPGTKSVTSPPVATKGASLARAKLPGVSPYQSAQRGLSFGGGSENTGVSPEGHSSPFGNRISSREVSPSSPDRRSWRGYCSGFNPRRVPLGTRDSSLSTPAKLPESFRVLINELHALCLSVYSNLPN